MYKAAQAQSSRKLRRPYFMKIANEGGKVVDPAPRPSLPPLPLQGNILRSQLF